MKRKKLSLEYISGLLTILIPRMEDTTKRQMLSLIFLVVATILEYIRGLLTVLTPRMEDATKRQMRSLISLVMAAMFTMTSFVPVVEAGANPYTITKIVDNVTYIGNGTVTDGNGAVTSAGDIISYHINVTNSGNEPLYNVNVTDPLTNFTDNVTVLGAGNSSNYTVNYTVTQGDINSNGSGTGFVNNTAFVYHNMEYPQNSSVQTPIIQDPALNITKTADPETYNVVDQTITYNYNVTNTGNVPVSGITVTDNKTSVILDNNEDLAPGTSVNGTATYTITQDDINAGSVTNNANATGTFNGQEVKSNNVNETVTAEQNPALNITKTADPETYNVVDQTITYNYNVTNTGNVPVSGITVTDNKTSVILDNNEDLAPGTSVNGTATYTITQDDINAGSVTNNANATGTFNGQEVKSNNVNETVTAEQNPALNITKTADPETYNVVDQTITYNYNVTNTGNVPVSGITVTDDKASVLLDNNEDLAPGTSVNGTATYTITQDDIHAGSVTNNANATGTFNGQEVKSDNVTATVTAIQNPNYTIDKTVTDVAGKGSSVNVTKAGDVIAYQVKVTNDGNIDLTNVKVNDSLTNLTGPVESLNANEILEVGENWTYIGTHTVTQADLNSNGGEDGFINNIATVDSDQLDQKNDSAEVPIEQIPSYSIDKTVTDVAGKGSTVNVTKAGDVIAYQVKVTNDGNIDLTNVKVNDSLTNLTGPVESLNANEIIEVGENWTYIGTHTVTQADLNSNGGEDGFINNIATVDSDQLDQKNDSAEVPIEQIPSYSIDKTITDVAGKGYEGNVTAAGDVIAYQINVTNDGNIDLNNVNVTDSLISLTGPVESKTTDGILGVEENWTYTGNYTVTQEEINTNGTAGDGFINNNATVDCDLLDPQNDTVQVPIVRDPSYTIDKFVLDVAGKGPEGNATEAGDVIAYQVNVTNDGNIDLTNVNVTDSLIGLAGPVESNSNDTILEVGENWTYTGNYTITQEDLNSNGTGTGFIDNTATVVCDQLGTQNSSVQTPLKRVADYSIFKSVIAPDEDGDCIVNSAGDEVPYRIVVKNDGNVDLTGVSVSDPMIILTGPTGDDIDPGVLNLGETWVYTGIYTLTPDDINNGNGYIDNIATVSSSELPDETSDVSQPIDQNADLSIQKSVIGIDEAGDYMINQPGDVINYQIAVKNNGNIDLTGVSVSDPIIILTGPTGDRINPGVLNPGETWVYTGDYEVTQEDIDGSVFIENTATVSCNELSEESSSTVLPIIPIPSIIVTPEPESKVLPIANFNANPMSGIAPLAVQFTDASQNAASRSWDFNNDGIADSSEVSPVHTYIAPGTYTANLTVSNANGTASKIATINVLKVTSPSGGSSGGSSHSSGGSIGGGKLSTVSSSTGNTSATGTAVIQPENKTQVEQKTETTAANVEQTPEQKNNTSTPTKESKRTPGFEIISGIVGLFSVFLYRRK
ncbi:MAG: beta strand repeat-containing protein [Methanosarcina sp.]